MLILSAGGGAIGPQSRAINSRRAIDPRSCAIDARLPWCPAAQPSSDRSAPFAQRRCVARLRPGALPAWSVYPRPPLLVHGLAVISSKLAPISFGWGKVGDRGRALSLGKKGRPLIYYLPSTEKKLTFCDSREFLTVVE